MRIDGIKSDVTGNQQGQTLLDVTWPMATRSPQKGRAVPVQQLTANSSKGWTRKNSPSKTECSVKWEHCLSKMTLAVCCRAVFRL